MEFSIPFLKKKPKVNTKVVSNDFLPPTNDGSVIVDAGGLYTRAYDGTAGTNSQKESISIHRHISKTAEVSSGINDIVNDAIILDEDTVVVYLEDTELSDPIKEKIYSEFDYILRLLNFKTKGHKLFEQWYVDGVQFHQKLINTDKPKDGILQVKFIDPLTIQKIKAITKEKNSRGIEVIKSIDNFFLIENTTEIGSATEIRLEAEAVAYSHSGIFDDKGFPISHLSKAVKPYNQLNDLEDSTVIYNITRAPEKRVFYVDVGNLPKSSAEQYMNGIITKYKNKTVYDSNTGQIKDSRHLSSMMEDIWLPRKEGSKGTEVANIGGGQGFDNIEEILYFRKKLYKSMNIPLTRLEAETGFSLGREGEITRDELKFGKFIRNLRTQFSQIFYDLLGTQLVLKGVMLQSEWDVNKELISFKFPESDYFTELTKAELLQGRIDLVAAIADSPVSKYMSRDTIRKDILRQTDEEIKDEDKQITAETNDPKFKPDEVNN